MDKVIYRMLKGEVVALFPQIAGGISGYLCQAYATVGQHGSADPAMVCNSRLATPEEYAKLHAELEQIGYNPVPAKKFTQKDYAISKAQHQHVN